MQIFSIIVILIIIIRIHVYSNFPLTLSPFFSSNIYYLLPFPLQQRGLYPVWTTGSKPVTPSVWKATKLQLGLRFPCVICDRLTLLSFWRVYCMSLLVWLLASLFFLFKFFCTPLHGIFWRFVFPSLGVHASVSFVSLRVWLTLSVDLSSLQYPTSCNYFTSLGVDAAIPRSPPRRSPFALSPAHVCSCFLLSHASPALCHLLPPAPSCLLLPPLSFFLPYPAPCCLFPSPPPLTSSLLPSSASCWTTCQ